MNEKNPKKMKLGEIVQELTEINFDKVLDRFPRPLDAIRKYNPIRERKLYEELNRREKEEYKI